MTNIAKMPAWRKVAVVAALMFAGTQVVAGTVVVTPGSLAGYTYFPKATSSGSGGGAGSGENVSTLQRCVYWPDAADKTVVVANDMFDYDKDLVFYYKVVGGNGGAGFNGGGGGSSAILLNGTRVALGPGGNGGSVAQEVSGFFKIKKGDTLRFIAGGGGGDGYTAGPAIGGGGGAGFTGGGGGASKAGAIVASEAATASGKGGGVNPGAGGTVAGGQSGTAGIGTSGGVSTFPSGSSAPEGAPGQLSWVNSWWYHSYFGPASGSVNVRHPAVVNRVGSPNGAHGQRYYAGGGGALGLGGSIVATITPSYCDGSNASITTSDAWTSVNDNGPCWTFYNQYTYHRARTISFPAPTADMRLTRAYPEVTNNGNNPIQSVGGSFPGQIIGMYQAPVCGILR